MKFKEKFIDLSKYFNKNMSEDKLLFIGMFMNFFLTNNNVDENNLKKSIEMNFNVEFKDEKISKDDMILKFVNKVINDDKIDLNNLLNKIFFMMNLKKDKNADFTEDSWESFFENMNKIII